MNFSQKLIYLRKQKSWSQEDLANELDVSRQSVYKWEAGECTPEIEKVRNIAKIFDVSFDFLLNDAMDTSSLKIEEPALTKNKKFEYRDVFDSKRELDYYTAEYEHGCTKKRQTQYLSTNYYEIKHNQMMKYLQNKGYKDIIKLQGDCCISFFIDYKTSSFGIFFDNAEQFVCPFENFCDVFVSNSGIEMGYRKTSILGLGFGDSQSVTVGSMPVAELKKPYMYYLTISYFNKNGELKEYKQNLNCFRVFPSYQGKDYKFWNDMTSSSTEKKLNDLVIKLKGIKELALEIKNGTKEVVPLDIEKLKSINKKATVLVEKEHKTLEEKAEEERKKRDKKLAITLLSIFGAIFLIAIIAIVI